MHPTTASWNIMYIVNSSVAVYSVMMMMPHPKYIFDAKNKRDKT